MLYRTARSVVHASSLPEVAQAALAGLSELVPADAYAVCSADLTTRQLTVLKVDGPAAAGLGWVSGCDLPAAPGPALFHVRERGALIGGIALHRHQLLSEPERDIVDEVAGLVAEGMRQARLRSELVAAHDAARRANERKTSFLNHLSHEIRTPLNAIIGYVELIREQASDVTPTDLSDDLGRVHAAANHLRELISEVLDLGKLEAGKLDLTLTTVDLVELVDDVEDVVRPLVAANGNRWSRDIPDEVWVLADPLRLRQVLLNLVGNAAKFTERGAVHLTVSHDARVVRIEVSDTGMGMDAAQCGRLFEPFQQVHRDASAYGGTGLGLTITKQYVELMGGRISVRSELGRGSVFSVELMRVIPD